MTKGGWVEPKNVILHDKGVKGVRQKVIFMTMGEGRGGSLTLGQAKSDFV